MNEIAFKLEPLSGSTIFDCLKQARILAIFLNEAVHFTFNDIELFIGPEESPSAVFTRYIAKRDHLRS